MKTEKTYLILSTKLFEEINSVLAVHAPELKAALFAEFKELYASKITLSSSEDEEASGCDEFSVGEV